jgi:hypothetical protein
MLLRFRSACRHDGRIFWLELEKPGEKTLRIISAHSGAVKWQECKHADFFLTQHFSVSAEQDEMENQQFDE